MTKKILFVIDRLNEGAGKVVYNIANSLDKNRFDVAVVSIYMGGNLTGLFDKSGIKVVYIEKKTRSHLSIVLNLRKIIKKEKADVVHTHNVDAYEYGVLAARLAGVKKIVHTSHGKSVKRGRFRRFRENLYHKFISLFLDRYIAVSRDLGKYAEKNWCLDKKKIKIVYNGVDTNKYRKLKVNRRLLNELNIRNGEKIIGIVAGLRHVKDHITLFKAMEIVKEEIPGSKLLVIGDGPEREKLIDFVNKSDLDKNIKFLGNREDIIELYNCMDVCVLCSLSECLSITLLEGMACCIPFVVTRVGGNPEVISDGADGFLVEAKDSNMIAEKIVKLLKDKELAYEIGKKAREKVLINFNVKGMVKKYEGLYGF